MVQVFFDLNSVIYTNPAPKGAKVDSLDIRIVLCRFMKGLKKKRLDMAAGDWYFFWDNTPGHTTAIVQDCRAAMNIKTILHLTNSPGWVPVDCFLFPRVKAELVGISVTHGGLPEGLGWGAEDRRQKGFRRRATAVEGAELKVYFNWRWMCRKILLNIIFLKMNSFHCMLSVRIALRHTSYLELMRRRVVRRPG
jgi:hypothetical protein